MVFQQVLAQPGKSSMEPDVNLSFISDMVLLYDGSSEHVAQIWGKIGLFEFDDSFDVTKGLQQIEMPELLHMCNHLI